MTQTKTSWQKGQSGNVGGRPKKGYSISETIREMFESDPILKKKLAKTIIDKAIRGDMSACKLIWSYADGLPRQGVDMSLNSGSLESLHIYTPLRNSSLL
ncbi:MAG: hypothetical protein ACD_40C00179G0002 [uncultured bacterium]|nr:MAG: hypothetical protein ACD_40C00179G0002 [uncultured bacterium]